ncbi:MAG: hypothetical protein PHS37_10340, partial [Candidatus Omnitrophica bacterium]|nr:hypothetical protein [Candidatus Omnitrophota bacterium]
MYNPAMQAIARNEKLLIPLAIVGIFFVYLGIGLSVAKDYGTYWDDPYLRKYAITTLNYIATGDRTMFDITSNINGPTYQLFLYLPERIFKLTAFDDIFRSRITLNFLFCATGIMLFFFLARYLVRDGKLALLGVLFMILTPRIFADSFYNTKDVAIMVMFIASMYTLMRYLDKKNLTAAAVHAVASAILVTIRIQGVIIPLLTVLFVAVDFAVIKGERKYFVEIMTSLFLYFFIFIPVAILLWPFLWEDPWGRFLEACKGHLILSEYSTPALYFGTRYIPREVPWHYTPAWIGITTPVLYLFFILAGMAVSLKKMIGRAFPDYSTARNNIILWVWVLVPVVLPVALGSPLYHAWRHHFLI